VLLLHLLEERLLERNALAKGKGVTHAGDAQDRRIGLLGVVAVADALRGEPVLDAPGRLGERFERQGGRRQHRVEQPPLPRADIRDRAELAIGIRRVAVEVARLADEVALRPEGGGAHFEDAEGDLGQDERDQEADEDRAQPEGEAPCA
jgi:hypothetical protein